MTYQIYTLEDALKPRQKQGYLVDKILPAGSLTIWYGYPGSLKSALIMDMAMAIATGKNFLPSMPNSGGTFGGFKTVQQPVLWIDIDNGNEVTAERIAAFARTYKADPYTPFFWMSYPTPSIQASSNKSMEALEIFIANLPILPKFIVLDTLLRAAKVKDENSSEMDTVMNNVHKLAEDLKASLSMISHSKKENYGRAGNGLRGHSSIEGGVDGVFYVKRENHSDIVQVDNQKARRKPVDSFSARWTFLPDPVDDALLEARFYWEPTVKINKQQLTIDALCKKIFDVLSTDGKMNKSELFVKVKGDRQNFYDALDKVIADGIIKANPGAYNAVIYETI